ncbi:MAG: exosortase/archaeosortase family protein [Bacteroidales bacterium]|jgi:exosortase/archaeosortase family protein|nr:exosortase/archaeosortase family protein [Bacteroidales bacterium]
MKLKEFIDNHFSPKQQQLLKDISLFVLATLIFHFLYWHTDMNSWLFGCFTYNVFEFFTNIAFNVSKWIISWLFSTDFTFADKTLYFYNDAINGTKHFFASMTIIHDCSGIKQIMQVFIFMLFVSGKILKKFIYWLCCSVVILLLNIIRIVLLTGVLVWNPSYFQPIHDWIGRPFMYVFIFLMWVVWIECFAYPKKVEKEKNKNVYNVS